MPRLIVPLSVKFQGFVLDEPELEFRCLELWARIYRGKTLYNLSSHSHAPRPNVEKRTAAMQELAVHNAAFVE